MVVALRYLKGVYSLDTLDTRFAQTSASKVKQQASIDTDGAARNSSVLAKQSSKRDASVTRGPMPLWRTREFYIYYFIFLTIPPLMFKSVYDVSKESDPNYPRFAPLLSQGWILGRKVDNSDGQYASFRNNIPYMAVAVILHPLLRKVVEYFTLDADRAISDPIFQGQSRLRCRVTYDLGFALLFTIILHGMSTMKILFILYLNFSIASQLPRKYIPWATWTFNIVILFANELLHGYRFAAVTGFLLPGTDYGWARSLDSFGGLIPRWEVLFKVTILRLISFNMDYYWSLENRGSSPVEKKQLDPTAPSERDRITSPSPPTTFTFFYYMAYILYSPLYLAGPIVTFNDYISQSRCKAPSIQLKRTILYGVRFLLALLAMELIIHYTYVVAISKSSPDWSSYTPFQLSMLGYFNLHHIWLKLLLPWRFFRFWALLDAIDPPENMVRCMSDNYSALAFWRGWHRSFNRWNLRYIFVPLGGTGRGTSTMRGVLNLLLVFMFVALWHDITAQLLAWSWLIVLFLLPEIVCTKFLFPARNYEKTPNYYRVLCGIGAVGNILMMMAANLVGFAVGLDGLQGLVKGIVGTWGGSVFFVTASATLFVGSQMMFEIRAEESRNGINLKC